MQECGRSSLCVCLPPPCPLPCPFIRSGHTSWMERPEQARCHLGRGCKVLTVQQGREGVGSGSGRHIPRAQTPYLKDRPWLEEAQNRSSKHGPKAGTWWPPVWGSGGSRTGKSPKDSGQIHAASVCPTALRPPPLPSPMSPLASCHLLLSPRALPTSHSALSTPAA